MAGRLYTLLGKVAGGVRLRTRLGRVVDGGWSGISSMASGDTSTCFAVDRGWSSGIS